MGQFFTDTDRDTLVFFQVPKVLVLGERYKKLKPNALKLYMVLFDRVKLSMTHGWKNSDGQYYVRMSQNGAAELFGWSPTTFRAMKKELEAFELLEQTQDGDGKSNRLYIKKCEYTDSDVYVLDKSVDDEIEKNEEEAQTIDKSRKNKSCSGGWSEVDQGGEQKLTPNKTELSNTDLNKNQPFVNKEEPVNKQSDTPSTFLTKKEEDQVYEIEKEYRLKGLSKEVIERVRNEVDENRGEVKHYVAYYRSCLENTLHKHQMKRGHSVMPYPHLGEDHPLNVGLLNE